MTDLSAKQDRASQLVKLNRRVKDPVRHLEDEYDNATLIQYSGSALVNILRFEESDHHPNDGMLMFVCRYSDETDTYTLECHMEVNYRTVPDNNDRYKFAPGQSDVDPLSFVETKIEQFKQVYSDPPELMSN